MNINEQTLSRNLKKFAKRYGSLFNEYGVSMKRHFREGKKSVTARGRRQCVVQRFRHT